MKYLITYEYLTDYGENKNPFVTVRETDIIEIAYCNISIENITRLLIPRHKVGQHPKHKSGIVITDVKPI